MRVVIGLVVLDILCLGTPRCFSETGFVIRGPWFVGNTNETSNSRNTIHETRSTVPVRYSPPRPSLVGFHIAMPQDSAEMLMRRLALRKTSFILDSLVMLESDSIRVLGQAAYIQLQFFRKKIRTIVVNFHPLGGAEYLDTRKSLLDQFEKIFGRGVLTQDQTVVHRRWETEDGTHEISYSDKYTRIFIRLGKREFRAS